MPNLVKISFPIRCLDTGEVFYQYQPYLFSRHWQIVRTKKKQVNPDCFCCGNQPIEIHHRDYVRIGREKLDDLVSLCPECHHTVHDLNLDLSSDHNILKTSIQEANELQANNQRRSLPKQSRTIRVRGITFDADELQAALYGPLEDLKRRERRVK